MRYVKVPLCRQVEKRFFTITTSDGQEAFDPTAYDSIYKIEPFQLPFPAVELNPIVIRNHDEILSREAALSRLGIDGKRSVCLVSYSGSDGKHQPLLEEANKLGTTMEQVTVSNGEKFPVVDCFQAVDLVISTAGYNSFWEVRYFRKNSIFIPMPKRFENQDQRLHTCRELNFDDNGADQLIQAISESYNRG